MDPVTEKLIKRNLEMFIDINGADTATASLRDFISNLESLYRISVKDKEVSKVLRDSLISFGVAANKADSAVSSLNKNIGNSNRNIQQMSRGFRDLVGSLKSVAGVATSLGGISFGFKDSIKYLDTFNKGLLAGSANWTKYGVGTATLEQGIKKISNVTHLTRMETMKLLSAYEKGFNSPSLKNAEQLFKNLRNAVGANEEAMNGMLQSVSSMALKYPDLEKYLTRLNNADKSRLSLINQQNVLLGTMSLQEAKTLQDYIAQNKQLAEADKAKKTEAQQQIDALQDIKKVMEEISMEIGKNLIPYIKEFAKILRDAKHFILDWIPVITKVSLLFAGLKTVFGFGRGLLGMGRGSGSGMMDFARALQTRAGTTGIFNFSGGALARAGGFAAAAYGSHKLSEYLGGESDRNQGFADSAYDRGDLKGGRGSKRASNYYGVGSDAAGVGAWALGGAAVGSVIPVIGTAMGALIGGAIGFVKNFDSIWKHSSLMVKDWLGMSQMSKNEAMEQSQAFKDASKYAQDIRNELRMASSNRYASSEERSSDSRMIDAIDTLDETSEKIMGIKENSDSDFNSIKDKSRAKNILGRRDEATRRAEDGLNTSLDKAKESNDQLSVNVLEAKKALLEATKAFQDAKMMGDASEEEMADLTAELKASKEATEKAEKERAAAYGRAESSVAADRAKQQTIASFGMRDQIYNQKLGNMIRSGGNFNALNQYQEQQSALASISGNRVNTTLTSEDASRINAVGGSAFTGGSVSVGQKNAIDAMRDSVEEELKGRKELLNKETDPTKRVVISQQIAEQEKTITAFKRLQNDIDGEIKEKVGDIDSRNGYILAAMNEQKMILESQNKLYDAQVGLTDSIIQNMSVTGVVDNDLLSQTIQSGLTRLEQTQKTLENSINLAKNQQRVLRVKDTEEYKDQFASVGVDKNKYANMSMTSSEMDKISNSLIEKAEQLRDVGLVDEAKKYLDAANAVNNGLISQNEQEANILKLEQSRVSFASKQLELVLKAKDAYQGQLDLANAQADYAHSQVEMMDSIGVGLRASVGARMQEKAALEEEQKVLSKQLQITKEQLATLPEGTQEWAKAQSEVLKIQTAQTNNLKRQYDITRQLRDGYVSAIQAAVSGTGLFAKILVDQSKNMGIGVKYLNVLQSKTSGGMGGGLRGVAGQFSAEGGMQFNGENQPGYKTYMGTSNYNPGYSVMSGQASADAQSRVGGWDATAQAASANPNLFGATVGGANPGVNRIGGSPPGTPVGTSSGPGAPAMVGPGGAKLLDSSAPVGTTSSGGGFFSGLGGIFAGAAGGISNFLSAGGRAQQRKAMIDDINKLKGQYSSTAGKTDYFGRMSNEYKNNLGWAGMFAGGEDHGNEWARKFKDSLKSQNDIQNEIDKKESLLKDFDSNREKTVNAIPTSDSPKGTTGSAQAVLSLDNVHIHVDYSSLPQVGSLIQGQIDKSMDKIADALQGKKSTTVPTMI